MYCENMILTFTSSDSSPPRTKYIVNSIAKSPKWFSEKCFECWNLAKRLWKCEHGEDAKTLRTM